MDRADLERAVQPRVSAKLNRFNHGSMTSGPVQRLMRFDMLTGPTMDPVSDFNNIGWERSISTHMRANLPLVTFRVFVLTLQGCLLLKL